MAAKYTRGSRIIFNLQSHVDCYVHRRSLGIYKKQCLSQVFVILVAEQHTQHTYIDDNARYKCA